MASLDQIACRIRDMRARDNTTDTNYSIWSYTGSWQLIFSCPDPMETARKYLSAIKNGRWGRLIEIRTGTSSLPAYRLNSEEPTAISYVDSIIDDLDRGATFADVLPDYADDIANQPHARKILNDLESIGRWNFVDFSPLIDEAWHRLDTAGTTA